MKKPPEGGFHLLLNADVFFVLVLLWLFVLLVIFLAVVALAHDGAPYNEVTAVDE
jgi:hypothetical protein